MLDRLLGCETEYAVRFTPQGGAERPSHELVFEELTREVALLVRTRPGALAGLKPQIFTENGGALTYEALPHADDDGLIEGSTPECRGPGQLLLYQKAQDELLLRALPGAQRHLERAGFAGTLGLVKNGRDVDGNVYGAQENYEVEIARGASLFFYRVGLVVLALFVLIELILVWAMVLVSALVIAVGYGVLSIVLFASPTARAAFHERGLDPFETRSNGKRAIGLALTAMEIWLCGPFDSAFALLLRACCFRRIRAQLTAFVVSRPLVSGTGTVEPDGRFGLSEKGPAINATIRSSVLPSNRPIFDTGNLMKPRKLALQLRLRPYRNLFGRRQRLQLGLSDSNAAQTAEYLKIATTALVLDMIEAGELSDAPRLKRPVRALHEIVWDPSGRATVETKDGRRMTALQIQRWYLESARAFVERSSAPSIEALEVLRLWTAALDALAVDPSRLVGRLDWVTKRYYIEAAGRSDRFSVRKKIDIRYHELGTGYLAEMERAGLAARLVSDDEVRQAQTRPPESSPAKLRGRMIRDLATSSAQVKVAWDSVQIGGRFGGKVVRLDDIRRDRSGRR